MLTDNLDLKLTNTRMLRDKKTNKLTHIFFTYLSTDLCLRAA